jgi:hypothetical protein
MEGHAPSCPKYLGADGAAPSRDFRFPHQAISPKTEGWIGPVEGLGQTRRQSEAATGVKGENGAMS